MSASLGYSACAVVCFIVLVAMPEFRKRWWMAPNVITLVVWIAYLAFCALQLLVYQVEVLPEDMLLLGCLILAVPIGCSLASLFTPKTSSESGQETFMLSVPERLILRTALLGIVPGTISIAITVGRIGLSSYQDLGYVRQLLVTGGFTPISGPLYYVLEFGSYFTWAASVLGAVYWPYLTRRAKWATVASMAVPSIAGLSWGGREPILLIGTVVVLAALLRRTFVGASKPSRVRALSTIRNVAVAVGILFLLTNFAIVRTGGQDSETVAYRAFQLLVPSTPSPVLSFEMNVLPPTIGNALLSFIQQLTAPMALFSVFLHISDKMPLFYGSWQIGILGKRYELIGLIPTSYASYFQLALNTFEQTGFYARTWQTTFSDMMLDFGIAGTFVAYLILGFMAQRVFASIKRHESYENMPVYVCLMVFLCWGPLISPARNPIYFFGTLYLVLISLAAWLRRTRLLTLQSKNRRSVATSATEGVVHGRASW